MQERRAEDFLAEVARAYYEQDLTQEQVAAQFGVSRSQVSRYLREARELHIVQIRIVPPESRDREAEAELRALFPHLRGAETPDEIALAIAAGSSGSARTAAPPLASSSAWCDRGRPSVSVPGRRWRRPSSCWGTGRWAT